MRSVHSILFSVVVTIASVGCSDDGSTPSSDGAATADRGPAADLSSAPDGPAPDGPAPDGPAADVGPPDQTPADQSPAPDQEAVPDLKPPDLGTAPDVGAGQCATHCDCTQGLLCTNGMCIAGFVPVYCCPKPGCPSGQLCYNPDGSKGTCP
jgi:hypothetical protein